MSVRTWRGRRVDANHAAIVEAFRAMGWSVQSLAAIGKGCPDLLVAKHGHTLVVEVKTPTGKLRDEQREWIKAWNAAVFIVKDLDDVTRMTHYADDWLTVGDIVRGTK